MRKLLYVILFLPLFSVAQVKVIAPVEPNNTSDTYPTHRDIYGQGGLMTVTTWAERNAISTDRRKLGMLVRVVGSGVDSTYTLVSGLANANWTPYTTGATGTFVTTNTEQSITAEKTFTDSLIVVGSAISVKPSSGTYQNATISNYEITINKNATESTKMDDSGFTFRNSGFGANVRSATLSSSRTWTFPDQSGTIAMLGDAENPLTFTAPLSRSTNTISIPAATSSVNGYLTSTDWTTFNNKVSIGMLASYVNTSTNQTIQGDKTFQDEIIMTPSPVTSDGTDWEIITRNTTSGSFEKKPNDYYATDANVVHLTGTESIAGAKTFADFINFTTGLRSGTTSYSQLEPAGITVGLTSNSTYTALNNGAISSRGSNANVQTLTFANATTTRSVTVPDLSGAIILDAGAQNITGEKTFTNYTYLTKLQTSSNASDSILVHSDFDDVIKLAPANYVTLSGNQDVGGMKTFTNGITIEDADGMFFEASPNTSEGGYEFLTRNTSTGLVEKLPSSSVAVDANVVHLAGTESVTGIKTFTDARIIDNGSLRFNDGANNGFLQNATLAESVTWTLPDRTGEVALKDDWTIRPISTKTANYTLTINDHYILVDATGGNITITVPAASGVTGQEWIIKRIDSSGNTVTIDPNGSETIDGDATATIGSQWSVVRFVSNGTNLFKTM